MSTVDRPLAQQVPPIVPHESTSGVSGVLEVMVGLSRKVVFLILLVLQLGLVWGFPRFATQDGPSHLYNAAAIAALQHSASWNGVSGFLRLNPRLVPNWTTYFILLQLMKVFSAVTAEKILVASYIVLFAFSFWWVVEMVRAGSEHFLIWGLVLGDNWFLSMGFYNFCFGLVFFLLCFGYWLKWRRRFGVKQWFVLLILASLLYFTHLFCFLMAASLIGITGLLTALSETRQSGEPGSKFRGLEKVILRTVVIPELCFLIFLLFNPFGAAGSQYQGTSRPDPLLASILHRVTHIFHLLLDSSGTLTRAAILALGVFIAVAFYLTFRTSKERISAVGCGLAIFSVICLGFYIFGPGSYSGTGLLRERTGWFGLWGVFSFLASREWKTRGKVFISVSAAVVCFICLVSGTIWRHQVSPLLGSYGDAARMVEPGKTMLSLCYCEPQNSDFALWHILRINPLDHAGDITALEGRDFDIANYEETGTSFPVEYLPEVNPAIRVPEIIHFEDHPGDMDIADYEEKTGRSVDYVLLWGAPDISKQSKGDSALLLQLQTRYTVLYSAPAPSLLRLFRRRV